MCMRIIFLLVWIFYVVKAKDDVKLICSPPTVQTKPGQGVVLSCAVKPPFDLTAQTVEWTRGTDVVVHRYRSQGNDKTDQHQKFRGRTVLIHQNLKDGNVSLRLINITKEDEGNYSCCLPNYVRCSNITLIVGPDPGDIAGIIAGVTIFVVGAVAVVLGILIRRNMKRTEPSQPPSDEGGVNPGQVSIPLMLKPSSETKSSWRCF
ncbi:myelin-oligodendrocyte glycoprotein [Oryzias melastigma]|uniref:myelin-oligodendrocyte glycoprotein n=1 Tax=Oryzias melastigma TaxID=30732 RepID=UPI000CF7E6B0|nr:myelin-oligodendrocyte glycoprotein [Oryzias melastigma]